MSTIKERLQNDWKEALKEKNKFKANVISTAKSSILHVEKTNNVTVEDTDIIEILAREIKQRKEAIIEFEKGNRQDLIDQGNAEIAILLEYLPKQLSEDEIRDIVKEAAEKVGASSVRDMGKVMGAVRPQTLGKADGKLVSEIVKSYLASK